jgi:hypothetical protein
VPLAPPSLGALVVAAMLVLLAPAATAEAAPPPNDSPATAAAFAPYTAANGVPQDQQAIAELFEATGEQHVPRCLGAKSFARTVWYRVPASEAPQEITVEASGRTLDVVDLAAFVQPEGGAKLATTTPNACDGVGQGGSDAGEEPTSAVTLQVPARHDVLIEVGRRGKPVSADDDRAQLWLDAEPLAVLPAPPGDAASPSTPRASTHHGTTVALGGATITEEDPAEAPCPSLGSVWRRVVPTGDGYKLISVVSSNVSTLTVYAGSAPTPTNALDCVVRSGIGALEMRVPTHKGKSLWVRLGADRPSPSDTALLRVTEGAGAYVVDGGIGGFDPTAGGPGGGFPDKCQNADAERSRVSGPRLGGTPDAANRRAAFTVKLRVTKSPVCDAVLELVGPGGRVYARGAAISLSGSKTVSLTRVRRLRAGRYRLEVSGLSRFGDRVPARSSIGGSLAAPRKKGHP